MSNIESVRSYAAARFAIVGETSTKRFRGKGGQISETNITVVDGNMPTDGNPYRGQQATMGFERLTDGTPSVARVTKFKSFEAAKQALAKQNQG